jgi:hypothetical protein
MTKPTIIDCISLLEGARRNGVPSVNSQPEGGAAGSETDGSAISETASIKVAQQAVIFKGEIDGRT